MELVANTLYKILHHGVTNGIVVGCAVLVMAWTLMTMVKEYRK